MERLLDKFILLIICVLLNALQGIRDIDVVPILLIITISGIHIIKKDERLLKLFTLCYILASIFHPVFQCYLPFLIYDVYVSKKVSVHLIMFAVPIIFTICVSLNFYYLSILVCFIPALILKIKYINNEELKKTYRLQRDDSKELTLIMAQKNKTLIIQQDQEIHIAILNERNRIAREIHDNVGHLLSSSLLQAGAIATLNNQDNLNEPIINLKNTLTKGLDNIRKNVHDLHDDAIDLETELEKVVHEFTFCPIHLSYDVYHVLPLQLVYHILSIIKEALHNIIKHSNATSVQVMIREQPVFYQLIIQDNGNNITSNDQGIGLTNMRDRVESMNGYISFQDEKGFRIFITLPKEEQQ